MMKRQERVNMLESGFAKGGQRWGTVDGGKLTENRRGCRWSRQRCLFFVLVFGAYLFFYNRNMKEMAPARISKWSVQYNATKWWGLTKNQTDISNNMLDSNENIPGPLSELTTGAQFNMERSLSAFRHKENITSTKVTDTNYLPHQTTNTLLAILKPLLPKLVPYKSPGPYLVEYPYEYHFIINEPQKCEQHKPFLVLMVPVAPHNRADRDIVRSTWGGEGLVLGKVVKLFFLLGLETGEGEEQLQEQLLQESKEHQDLIQSDFLDCYKNLTIKTMVMLEWLDSHCSSASFAMKIDSDMFLNLPNLIHMLLNAPKTNYMTGLVERGATVRRNPWSKWYVPVRVYPRSRYPRYALGLGYILSLDLPKKLVEASKHVQALYLEDVYLGLCMQYLGILPTDPPKWSYFNVFPVPYSRCAYSRLIATTTHEKTDRVRNWKDFKKPGPYCQLKKTYSQRRT